MESYNIECPIIDPQVTLECIHTLRTSSDPQEVSAAWAWLECAYGRNTAMEYLSAYDAEHEEIVQ